MKKQFFRVKHFADQTFLRGDKTKGLSDDELIIAELKVEFIRHALTAINKKLPPGGPNVDLDKRAKKCLEYQLGSTFADLGSKKRDGDLFEGEADCKLFQCILREAGEIEHQLAKEYAEHEIKVEEMFSNPIQKLLDTDFPLISKHKRNVNRFASEKESTTSRFQATKKDAVRDEMDEADIKLEQTRDCLAIEMFNLLAKENDISSYVLQLLKLQRAHHESALNSLQSIIPQLEKKIGHSSIKKVFGIALEDHLAVTGKHIAYPLEICVAALSELGMHEEGLFRLTGSTTKVKRLKASIDSGCFCEMLPEYRDVHVIAGILKLYLRELPEPLLTYRLYKEWMQIGAQPDHRRVEHIKKTVEKLPIANRQNLAYLVQFLARLSRNTANKMSSSNIAIVISPNLLWAQDDSTNLSMGNCSAANLLVELFIKEVDAIFPDDVSHLATPLCLFPILADSSKKSSLKHENHDELNVSSESIQTIASDSPRPNARKKKSAAPVPPSGHLATIELPTQEDRAALSASYPSGSTTLIRKPKEKVSSGTDPEYANVISRRASFNQDDKRIALKTKNLLVKKTDPTSKASTSTTSTSTESVPQEKKFVTTATHSVVHNSNRPVAAPRSNLDPGKTVVAKISSDDIAGVQLRRHDATKPEIPARPPSLQQKRSSSDVTPPAQSTDQTLQITQCSVSSLASKQQPSFVNLSGKSDKYQLGHDSQFAEKEKFLGHLPGANDNRSVTPLPRTKLPFSDQGQTASEKFLSGERQLKALDKPAAAFEKPPIAPEKPQLVGNATTTPGAVERPTSLQPKSLSRSMMDKSRNGASRSDTARSSEKLHEIANNSEVKKSSHVRTRSDGNIIDLKEDVPLSPLVPPSPRSLNKPTEPPPPPPVQPKKPDNDNTKL